MGTGSYCGINVFEHNLSDWEYVSCGLARLLSSENEEFEAGDWRRRGRSPRGALVHEETFGLGLRSLGGWGAPLRSKQRPLCHFPVVEHRRHSQTRHRGIRSFRLGTSQWW